MQFILVTAYFPLKSKQPESVYFEYIQRFLRACPQHDRIKQIVFFTTSSYKEKLQNLSDKVNIIVCPDDITLHLMAFKNFSMSFWLTHHERDIEKQYHSPELSAMWYEKPHFIARVFEENKVEQEEKLLYVWIDAGCVRDDTSERAWSQFGTRMSPEAFEVVCKTNQLCLQTIRDPSPQFMKYEEYHVFQGYEKFIAGAIMMGTKKAWIKHISNYDQMLTIYDNLKLCGSKDQHVIRSCAEKFKTDYFLFGADNSSLKVDEWFFFLQYI
jgi:hypothetical protein